MRSIQTILAAKKNDSGINHIKQKKTKKQTNKQTNKQTTKQTNKQTSKQNPTQVDKRTHPDIAEDSLKKTSDLRDIKTIMSGYMY